MAGCNAIFGIHEGTPRPLCADPLTVDDMEDGDRWICRTDGRSGSWYVFGDGSAGELSPKDAAFAATRIEDGARGTSRYAAHFAGSGFTKWGAIMGLDLQYPKQAYDLGSLAGLTFWMKSDVPVQVSFPTWETAPIAEGGECVESATPGGCNQNFAFQITAPADGWGQAPYQIPFNALTSASPSLWDPRHLLNINFHVPSDTAFDVWIDDVAFYHCAGPECQPTCTDPRLPVSCRIGNGRRSSCQPAGTDCAVVAGYCADPLLLDDLEDGDDVICDSRGRRGGWYVVGDGTSKDLAPGEGALFVPSEIPGGREGSHRAARLTGSGFWAWGAEMGFGLSSYDASQVSGIQFWMKSDVPVVARIPTPATTPATQPGGACQESATPGNCNYHFTFDVGASGDAWVLRRIPFAALRQTAPFHGNGNLRPTTATWDPSQLLGIDFGTFASAFDIWIDDVSFYTCQAETCLPTCPDELPTACPATSGRPADCWPKGTDCANPPERLNWWGAWGSGPADVWIAGYRATALTGVLLHWNGSAWSTDQGGARPPMFALWGSTAADVWAMGDQGTILHGNGIGWIATPSGTSATFNGIWGSGPSDVWAIESPGTMRHWDGSAWSTRVLVPGGLWALWGSGPRDVFVVGDDGVMHWDGSAWSSMTGASHPLFGVWGASAQDVWAVGGAGTIMHWNGSAWLPIPSGTPFSLIGVWGSGPADVWAVGTVGTIVHWDGVAWRPFASGTMQKLNAVWGSGANDVWAIGHGSTILHWDGASWSPVSP